MDNQQRKLQAPMVGGSSLLIIFAVLCLTVFALLGISTVQADRRLADASIKAVTAYYEADCEAERILSGLRGGEIPDGVQCEDGVYRFSLPVSENQMLLVEATVESADKWEITCWRTLSTTQSNAEELLNVWTGDI